MTAKLYSSYKDSGSIWLNKVPAHWKVAPLKRLLNIQNGADQKAVESEEGFPIYGSGGIFGYANQYLYDGKSVLLGRKGTIDKPLFVDGKFWTVDTMYWSKILPTADPKFSYYLATRIPFDFYSTSTALPSMTKGDLGTHIVAYPEVEEQQRIANYLDRETARIDDLIQRQESLIELIQEKITSVTDGFVTKGLDKSASLKETKFQTLGKVPSHWDVLQIKKIVSTPVTDGPHETPEFLDEGVAFVSAEAVSKGFIDFEKIRGFISPEANKVYSRKYSPQIHDIYMIKSGATTGVTAIVEDRTDFNIWSPLAVIRCSKRMNPYYVLYAMRSKYFQEMVSLSWSFGTQQNIGMGVIENLCIPVPPREEQDAIVLKIKLALGGLKQLQDKAMTGILLLKEHRVSLISSAVTGKIDVRESV